MSTPNFPRPTTSHSPSPSPSLNNERDQVPQDPSPAALPLPMSASIVLSTLPRDAHAALRDVDARDVDTNGKEKKVRIRLSPLPMAPPLAQKTFQISRSNKFASIIAFLRKKLGLKREEGVFCYVNSVFAPGLDEGVGGLWDCFKTGVKGDEALVVGYSMTPAFG